MIGLGRIWQVRLLGLLVVLLASPAAAQALPAAGDLGMPSSGAWVILPSEPGWAGLAHVPPRRSGAGDGELRWARRLARAPVGVVAADSEIFLFFPPLEGEGARRRVTSLTAVQRAGQWFEQPAGRLVVRRSLPPAEALLDVAAAGDQPAALLETSDGRRLVVLEEGEWVEASLPVISPGSELRLVSGAGGLRVLEREPDGELVLWSREEVAGEGPPWLARPLPPVEVGEILSVFDGPAGLVLAQREGERLVLLLIHDERVGGLGEAQVGLGPVGVAALGDDQRLAAIILAERPEGADDAPGEAAAGEGEGTGTRGRARPPRMVEMSLLSGRVLYDGPARFAMPVTRTDLRALGVAMLLLVMLVIAFLLGRETEEASAVRIPEGYAIVEDGRRLAAGLIDLLAAAWIASLATGASLAGALGVELLAGGGRLAPVLVTVGVGFLLSVLGEALSGRSLGKALAGCRVVIVGEGERAPGLWRAIVRNACKWAVPPLAWMAYLDAERRHRGDVLARTVVVSPIEEDAEAADDDGEEQ